MLLIILLTLVSARLIRQEESAQELGHESGLIEDSECTEKGHREFRRRFEAFHSPSKSPFGHCTGLFEEEDEGMHRIVHDVGRHFEEWEQRMVYISPQDQASGHLNVAVYLYPACDHDGAFSMCDADCGDSAEDHESAACSDAARAGSKHAVGDHICARLLTVSMHSSVWLERVDSVQYAQWVMENIRSKKHPVVKDAKSVTMTRLIFGGHGNANALWWGPGKVSVAAAQCRRRDNGCVQQTFMSAATFALPLTCDMDGDALTPHEEDREVPSPFAKWSAEKGVAGYMETITGTTGYGHGVEVLQRATDSFLTAVRETIQTIQPGNFPTIILDSCNNGVEERDTVNMNMGSMVAAWEAGSEVCASKMALDASMWKVNDVRTRDLWKKRDVEDLKLGMHGNGKKNPNMMECKKYPAFIQEHGLEYYHHAMCTRSSKRPKDGGDWGWKEFDCPDARNQYPKQGKNSVGLGAHFEAACEHEQMDQCGRWCGSTDGCTAFTFFDRSRSRKTNCEIHTQCSLTQENGNAMHARTFRTPKLGGPHDSNYEERTVRQFDDATPLWLKRERVGVIPNYSDGEESEDVEMD